MKILSDRIKIYFDRFKSFQINTSIFLFTTVYSLFTALVYNIKFFKGVYLINHSFLAVIVSFVLVVCLYNTLFALLFQRKITKFFAIFFLLGNAGTLYFMNTYNVAIDRVMLLNVRETNLYETLELLNFVWFSYMIFLGVLPSIIVLKTKINYGKIKKELLYRFLTILIILIVCSVIVFVGYKSISSTVRQNKKLKHILVPFNYIDAGFSLMKKNIKHTKYKFEDITTDVVFENVAKNGKKNLVIFVVGEASRDKNWSLSGYENDTNEYLKGQDVIYYDNFFSCGTSTAISVPCMFSNLSRTEFDIEKRDAYSNLLDFLKKADFNVIWRENNSDCKGVCLRVDEDNFVKNKKNKKFCNDKECFDEILVDDLQDKINNLNSQNNFIVLHQKGSHGPAYHSRYPKEFEKFTPICINDAFNGCSRASIVNTYDNTINYTSFVLNRVIETLKDNQDKYNVALIYVSDHGQSLGERGMYLHGAPYRFSPEEQRHIPFFLWLSDGFREEFSIDESCLRAKQNQELSHDNIFHSVLGMFGIETKYYRRELDIFSDCRVKEIKN